MVKIFGAEKVSYTTAINFGQCRYRLYLMGKALDEPTETLLFPPMIRGLFLHLLMEEYIRHRFEGKPPSSAKEVWERLRYPVRSDVDFGKRKLVFASAEEEKEFRRKLFAEGRLFVSRLSAVIEAFEPFGLRRLSAEVPLHRDFRGYQIVGHTDLLAETDLGFVCADLKTGRGDINSDQFLLYSWLANGFRAEPIPFLMFLWDGEKMTTKETVFSLSEDNPSLMRLLWSLSEINLKLREAEERIREGKRPSLVLRPNTKGWTCHPKRCSFWEVCPYGKVASDNDTDR